VDFICQIPNFICYQQLIIQVSLTIVDNNFLSIGISNGHRLASMEHKTVCSQPTGFPLRQGLHGETKKLCFRKWWVTKKRHDNIHLKKKLVHSDRTNRSYLNLFLKKKVGRVKRQNDEFSKIRYPQ
jgi:hypothetical protein